MTPCNPSTNTFTIREASWQADNSTLRALRESVFMQEQGVPVELEWDGRDENATHLLAEDELGNPIATARMLADGHIGRVAVLKPWRRRGVGTALMRFCLTLARQQGLSHVHLDAQMDALPFYTRLGFIAEGEVFMDAGIPHRHMQLRLEEKPGSE